MHFQDVARIQSQLRHLDRASDPEVSCRVPPISLVDTGRVPIINPLLPTVYISCLEKTSGVSDGNSVAKY